MTPPILTHRLAGDGPFVALVNGGMMTFAAWEPVATRLRARYRTLLFDFRGQLLSPGEPPADLAGHAEDLAALLDATGCAPAHLIGTSFGAMVALELAARSPERVRSLVLVTVMTHATEVFRQGGAAMRAVVAGILAGEAREPFYDILVEGTYSTAFREREAAALALRRSQIGLMPPAWFAGVDRLLATVEGFDLRPRLAAVRCPVRVVSAAGDRIMDLAASQALATALGADSVVHPSAGHGLVVEEPAWLADVCLEHLDRCSTPA